MNIYILTEEKPKVSTIKQILNINKDDFGSDFFINGNLTIKPIFINSVFQFEYEVLGATVKGIDHIFIRTVSGGSSFLDFLFFVQNSAPVEGSKTDHLLFAVEETKTSDDESRNTGVFQRCSKFVYIKPYYQVPLYMLYNDELELRASKKPSDTSIFGTNMLLTCGVKIVGKPIDKWFKKFSSINELISFKNSMRMPPANNTPILIKQNGDTIYISGRLDKPKNIGKISHDPNIGALTMISYTLRKLGWKGKIIITEHRISQSYISSLKSGNKFLFIAQLLDISLDKISINKTFPLPTSYWHYESSSEKMASILFHILCENIGLKEVYQNHAGCERGYFRSISDELIVLPKKVDEGTVNERNLLIPDVVIRDDQNKKVYLIEGKKLSTISAGLQEIKDYDDIEKLYINTYYPNYSVERYLTIFGGELSQLPDQKVLLYLSNKGNMLFNDCEKNLKARIYATL